LARIESVRHSGDLADLFRGIMQGDSVPDVFVPQLIDFWRQGRFPFDRLIEFYDLDDINEAVRASESGAVIKPVVRTGRR